MYNDYDAPLTHYPWSGDDHNHVANISTKNTIRPAKKQFLRKRGCRTLLLDFSDGFFEGGPMFGVAGDAFEGEEADAVGAAGAGQGDALAEVAVAGDGHAGVEACLVAGGGQGLDALSRGRLDPFARSLHDQPREQCMIAA